MLSIKTADLQLKGGGKEGVQSGSGPRLFCLPEPPFPTDIYSGCFTLRQPLASAA